MKNLVRHCLLLSTVLLGCWSCAAQEKRPNVVVFFIDDLGWTDIAVNGSSFHETPNIDALATGGVNFMRSYSANPVCSPTRAALMTGKAPQRVGITQWIARKSPIHLPLPEITIGEAFQEAGYYTGYIGKWHLGKEDNAQPQHQGFEFTKAVNRAGQPASYFYPFGKGNGSANVPD
jgi:arylsulfatase A-like enzyme